MSEQAIKILIVEDEQIVAVAIEGHLQGLGYQVVGNAASGQEACEKAAELEPDLVLMDIQMPEVDGFQATAMIRACEKESGRPRIPIVAVTAHALIGYREKCLAADMDDYITKPLRKQLLLDMSRKWLTAAADESGGKPGVDLWA